MQESSEKLQALAYVWNDANDPNLYGDWDFEVFSIFFFASSSIFIIIPIIIVLDTNDGLGGVRSEISKSNSNSFHNLDK